MSLTSGRSSLTCFTVSVTVLNIFQLPAMSGVRINLGSGPAKVRTLRLVRQRRNPGQDAAAEELERRATAGRDVRDAVRHARLRDRSDRIAAADDGRAI